MTGEEEIAYLAGFFDGEGCIYIHKSKGIPSCLQIEAGQNVLAPLEVFQHIFSGKIKKYHDRKYSNDKYKWYATSITAYRCLKTLLPYLIVKKNDALLAIEYYELMKSQKRVSNRGERATGASHFLKIADVDQRWSYYHRLSKTNRVFVGGFDIR